MSPAEHEDPLHIYRSALNTESRRIVAENLQGPDALVTMIKYHLGWVDEAGRTVDHYAGKQLRPILLLLSAQAAGGDWQRAVAAAAAIELIHNFSLVHDDIEDNSPLRRGRPTLWRLWGASEAINAGDTMFALAHTALLSLSARDVPAERLVKILSVFEQTILQLTRGQHLDMTFERQMTVTPDEYLDMIGGKSAALIGAAMEIGALIGGLSSIAARKYANVGFHLGLAFQIQDDILGIWGDPAVTGKSVSTDIATRKKSLPVLYGLARNPAFAAIFRRESLDEADVAQAVALLEAVGAREDAESRVRGYFFQVQEGLSTLEALDNEAIALLLNLVQSLVNRGT